MVGWAVDLRDRFRACSEARPRQPDYSTAAIGIPRGGAGSVSCGRGMRYFAAPAPTTRPGDAGEIGGAVVLMTLRVSVDQAMRTVFSELAKRFQIDHPGTQIQLKFKRSQELADELEREPAPDVLVVQDVDMHRAAQAGR